MISGYVTPCPHCLSMSAHTARFSSRHVMMISSCNISSHALQQKPSNLLIQRICLALALTTNLGGKRNLRMVWKSQTSLWRTIRRMLHILHAPTQPIWGSTNPWCWTPLCFPNGFGFWCSDHPHPGCSRVSIRILLVILNCLLHPRSAYPFLVCSQT